MNTDDAEAILYSKMGFCGCTEEAVVLDDFITVLEWAEKKEWQPSYETLLGNRTAFYLVAGLLDQQGFVEHGIAIRYPWITEQGKEFLSALKQLRAMADHE